jgi:tRNA G10  N-methylase Trm11
MLYLVQFYDEWIDFRIAEISALLKLQCLNWADLVREDIANPIDLTDTDPRHFYIVEFPNEEVIKAVCSRAILVKAVYELWSSGPTLAAAIEATHQIPQSFLQPILSSNDSWAVHVNTFGRTLTMEQKQECRLNFKFLDFQGPVSVTAAQLEMWISLDYNKYRHSIASMAAASGATEANILTLTDVPTYFGRLVAKGGMKEVVRIYDLKKRIYLGPTSLDDSLALILSNISGVTPGMLAYDPFVGTASILIALTHFGALCTGSDIDPRVLRGEMHAGAVSEDEGNTKASVSTTSIVAVPTALTTDATADTTNTTTDTTTDTTTTTSKRHLGVAEATAKKSKQSKVVAKKRNIFENFKSYGLPAPELIRMDNHLYDRHITLQHTANGRAAAGCGVLSRYVYFVLLCMCLVVCV